MEQVFGARPSRRAWVVVNTHPHKERFALENLQRQGFDTYCPQLRVRIRHARKSQDVLRPMFPGYVFAAVSRDVKAWRPMLSTFGVRTVVRSGDGLCFLPDAFIDALQEREIDGAIQKPASPYRLGQEVRIVRGPFSGLVATIVEMSEQDRLVVLMNLLNNRVKVKTDTSHVAEMADQRVST